MTGLLIEYEKTSVAKVPVSELQRGMKIINVGIVKEVTEYANVTVVHLHGALLNNAATQAEYSPWMIVKCEVKSNGSLDWR